MFSIIIYIYIILFFKTELYISLIFFSENMLARKNSKKKKGYRSGVSGKYLLVMENKVIN